MLEGLFHCRWNPVPELAELNTRFLDLQSGLLHGIPEDVIHFHSLFGMYLLLQFQPNPEL